MQTKTKKKTIGNTKVNHAAAKIIKTTNHVAGVSNPPTPEHIFKTNVKSHSIRETCVAFGTSMRHCARACSVK